MGKTFMKSTQALTGVIEPTLWDDNGAACLPVYSVMDNHTNYS